MILPGTGNQTSRLYCGREEISMIPGATAASVLKGEVPFVYSPTSGDVLMPDGSGLGMTANVPWSNV